MRERHHREPASVDRALLRFWNLVSVDLVVPCRLDVALLDRTALPRHDADCAHRLRPPAVPSVAVKRLNRRLFRPVAEAAKEVLVVHELLRERILLLADRVELAQRPSRVQLTSAGARARSGSAAGPVPGPRREVLLQRPIARV